MSFSRSGVRYLVAFAVPTIFYIVHTSVCDPAAPSSFCFGSASRTVSSCSSGSSERRVRSNAELRQEAYEIIWRNQNPERCDHTTRAHILQQIDAGYIGGLGASLVQQNGVFNEAILSNRTFIIREDWPQPAEMRIINGTMYEANETGGELRFCERGLNCFLLPYSKCSEQDLLPIKDMPLPGMGDRKRGAIPGEPLLSPEPHLYFSEHGKTPYMIYHVPEQFRHGPDWTWDLLRRSWSWPHQLENVDAFKQHAGEWLPSHTKDLVWWRGQLTAWEFRLNDAMLERVEQYRKEIAFQKPIACMHVRRGDKVRGGGEANLIPVSRYIETALEYRRNYSDPSQKMRLMVLSDAVGVFDEIIAANVSADFDFIFGRPELPSIWGGFETGILKLHPALLLKGVVEFALLCECDYLIGTLSSFYFKAAVYIQHAYHDVVNYTSLDMSFDIGSPVTPHWRAPNFHG
eukprot:TRINITY_DN10093_c0_g1_i1.p1 TRINITY_DN10093_c0_g1~~TRINITY_DN10093_c0_g1_i1.p1  ORF type:complete len:460 (-),score=170.04 TRINITY_DN10093_c0_g1_i1:337-1716(-)